MSTLSDYDENVQCYILQQFQRAAVNRHHHRWLHGYGFNAAMINQLARLPTETLLKLARSNPIRLGRTVDDHLIERRHRPRHIVNQSSFLPAPPVE